MSDKKYNLPPIISFGGNEYMSVEEHERRLEIFSRVCEDAQPVGYELPMFSVGCEVAEESDPHEHLRAFVRGIGGPKRKGELVSVKVSWVEPGCRNEHTCEIEV